ncbi:MAG: hypothetical protein QXJ24_06145 [Thermoplasmatales archaeon]
MDKSPSSPSPSLRILAWVIALILIVSAIFFVTYPLIEQSQSSNISFTFLSSSVLNKTYDTNFITTTLSSPPAPILSIKNITAIKNMAYFSTNSSGGILTVIIEMKSNLDVGTAVSSISENMLKNAPQIFAGTYKDFVYFIHDLNSTQVFLSYSGNFILFMAFEGFTVSKDIQIYKDQVTVMLPSHAPSPTAVPISGSLAGIPLSQIFSLVLTFASGLLIGLAFRKGITAIILGIIGIVVGTYAGLTFLPQISITYELKKWSSFLFNYISTVKFGAVTVSLDVILFLIGLAIGIWKG